MRQPNKYVMWAFLLMTALLFGAAFRAVQVDSAVHAVFLVGLGLVTCIFAAVEVVRRAVWQVQSEILLFHTGQLIDKASANLRKITEQFNAMMPTDAVKEI